MAWPNADGQIPPLSPPLANDVLEYFEVSIGPPGG
jgi:hypothetical protein